MLSPLIEPRPPAAARRADLTRRRALRAAALFLGASLLAKAPARAAPMTLSDQDKALLAQIETYLNAQKSVTANFLQVAADGSTRTGKAWLQRPGKMRFAYDPPDPQLLVAGFGILTYYDPDLGQTSNIPLSTTPLGILLAPRVDLESSDVYVTNILRQPGQVDVTLVRKGKEAAGSLTLSFMTDPLELRGWVVTDAQGKQTIVHLYDISPAARPFPDSLFQFTPATSPIPSGG